MGWRKGIRRQHRHQQGQSDRLVEKVNNHQQRYQMPLAKAQLGDLLQINQVLRKKMVHHLNK